MILALISSLRMYEPCENSFCLQNAEELENEIAVLKEQVEV